MNLTLRAKTMRAANILNAVLMLLVAPTALAHGLANILAHDRLAALLLSLYVAAFGTLLLALELGLHKQKLKHDLGFLHSYAGRCAFLLLVANLMWGCPPYGYFAAIRTNANALRSAYALRSHPAYASGRRGRLNIEDDVHAPADDDAILRDPSSVAAVERAAFERGRASVLGPGPATPVR